MKKCVYTVITNNYDVLLPQKKQNGWDFICFSDVEFKHPTWECCLFNSQLDPHLASRLPKVLPHAFLKNYDYSVYIDAITTIKCDLNVLCDSLQWPDFCTDLHKDRNCVYEEIKTCQQLGKGVFSDLEGQRDHYLIKNMPKNYGLFENGILLRAHKKPNIVSVDCFWWSQTIEFSYRDQVSLPFSCWKFDFKQEISVFPKGTKKDNFDMEIIHRPSINLVRIKEDPHKLATDIIRPLLLGSVEEISRKTPWGFNNDFKLNNISIHDFLSSSYNFVETRILHILCGEGEDILNVKKALNKSIKESIRLLILEHNPQSIDWESNNNVCSKKINIIEDTLKNENLYFKKIYIGDGGDKSRNVLYDVFTIPYVNLSKITKNNIEEEKNRRIVDISGRDIHNKVYTLSSEDFRKPNELYSSNQITEINDYTKKLISVIGGQMFLDSMYFLDINDLWLFDACLSQILYTIVLLDGIKNSENIDQFNDFLKKPYVCESLQRKISFFWDFDMLSESIVKSKIKESENQFEYRWRNIPKIGIWRTEYSKVRAKIINSMRQIHFGFLSEFDFPFGSAVYISTIDKQHWAHLNNHLIISCLNPRDSISVIRNIKDK